MIRGYQPKGSMQEQEGSRPKGGSAADKTVKIRVDTRSYCDECYQKGYREGFIAGDKNAFVFISNIIETEIKAVEYGAYGQETALDFAHIVVNALKGGEQE